MNARSRLQAAALVYTLLGACTAQASSAGMDSSGFPAGNACNACHSGAATPSVSLSGPSRLLRGSVATFTFTIATGGVEGGLNVATSGSGGTLFEGGPSSGNTRTIANDGNGQTEITHSSPRNFADAGGRTFSFRLSANANAACDSTVTLKAWGLAANGTGTVGGDAAASDTHTVSIGCPPTIATTASSGIVLGAGSVTDSAIVSGRFDPVSGATINFRLYGPDDDTCSNGSVFLSSNVTYPAAGGSVVSLPFTPQAAGTYRWRAFYNADANNPDVAAACNAPNESVVVARATPTMTSTASTDIALGGQVLDRAVISGRINPQSGATVSFRLYGPNDALCATTPVFQSLNLPYSPAGGSVTSAPYIPTASGVYRWRASYSGDVNNSPLSGVCNQLGQDVIVVEDDYSFGNGFEAP